jgi:coenzyme PQQ precursor peptide PqqA
MSLAPELVHLSHLRRLAMKWSTPEALEFRFGMEITMYVANR